MLSNLRSFFFGDDIFLSYSRKDGSSYVASLAKQLSAGSKFKVFFDHYGTPPGKELPQKVLNKAMNAKMFVLVASDGALLSKHVMQETRTFIEKRHKRNRGIFQCINFGNFDKTDWVIKDDLHTISYVTEKPDYISRNTPSDEVIQFITDSFLYNRSNQNLKRTAWIIGVVIFFMLLTAGYFGNLVLQKTTEVASISQQAQAINADLRQRTAELQQTKKNIDSLNSKNDSLNSSNISLTSKNTEITEKLTSSTANLTKTETLLNLSKTELKNTDLALKEELKSTYIERSKKSFENGDYNTVYNEATEALQKYRREPSAPMNNTCDTNQVTEADLSLSFLAAIASNYTYNSPAGSATFETISAMHEQDGKFFIYADGTLHVEDPKITDDNESLSINIEDYLLTDQAPYMLTAENTNPGNYLSDDSLSYKICLYKTNPGLSKLHELPLFKISRGLSFTVELRKDITNQQFIAYTILPIEGDNDYEIIKYKGFSIQSDKIHPDFEGEVKIPRPGYTPEVILPVKNTILVSQIENGSMHRYCIGANSGEINPLTIPDRFMLKIMNPLSAGTACILEKDSIYFAGLMDEQGTVGNLSRIILDDLKNADERSSEILYMDMDTLAIKFSTTQKVCNKDVQELAFLKKDPADSCYHIFFKKELPDLGLIDYDASTGLLFFSDGRTVFYQPVSSGLIFKLGYSPGRIMQLKSEPGSILAYYNCQADPGDICLSLLSWEKPFLKKFSDLKTNHQITPDEMLQLNQVDSFYFNDNLDFIISGETSYIPIRNCNNAHYDFLFKVADQNYAHFYDTEEEMEQLSDMIIQDQPNEGVHKWINYQYSPDGRWALIEYENTWEILDLIHKKNLSLNLAISEMDIPANNTDIAFSKNGDYLFIFTDDYILRLNAKVKIPGTL